MGEDRFDVSAMDRDDIAAVAVRGKPEGAAGSPVVATRRRSFEAPLVREGLEYVAASGADGQGLSVFAQHDGTVFHTYAAYGAGLM